MIYLDSQHKLSRLFGVLSAPLEELSGANPHQYYARKLCSQTRGVLLTSLHRLRYWMVFDAVTVAKIALWNAMMQRDMRKADLCRLLGVHQAQGDRLVDFLHTSKIEQLEAALKAFDLRLSVTVQPYGAECMGFRGIDKDSLNAGAFYQAPNHH